MARSSGVFTSTGNVDVDSSPLVVQLHTNPYLAHVCDGDTLNVSLISDTEIIVHGLISMLAPYSNRVRVGESGMGRADLPAVDLTLIDRPFDTPGGLAAIDRAVADPQTGAVVVFAWEMTPAVAQQAMERGCRGCLDKALQGADLVIALERIDRGHPEISPRFMKVADSPAANDAGSWPGRLEKLSRREAEVISMIVEGYTNVEIAQFHYISINTVKSYVRTAYRKIGVDRRSQAVRWGIEHGMLRHWRQENERVFGPTGDHGVN